MPFLAGASFIEEWPDIGTAVAARLAGKNRFKVR
jgi:hypothetical protein